MIAANNQPICMPGNSTITVLGKLSKLIITGSYMIELAVHNNLPSGVVVNCSYVTPKAGQVAAIPIKTNSRNIWIHMLKYMNWSCIPGSINPYCIERETQSRLGSSQ